MTMHLNRRHLLISGAAAATLMLPGCQSFPALSLTEAIRRLLTLSSQAAFAMLLQPNGFYDNQIARIDLPEKFGGRTGANILAVVLQSRTFRDHLQRQLNRAAEKGAERAAPLVAEAVRTISIEDAAAIVRGGGRQATLFLRQAMASSLSEAMFPGITEGLRLFDDQVISQAIKAVSGFDISALSSDITAKAEESIWTAIGSEEERIRANPQSTNDPLLIGVFGLGSKI